MAADTLPEYTIRPMRREEIEESYELIDKEGWNLTLEKLSHLFKSCPQAFKVAVTPQGEIVGTISFFPTFDGECVLGNIVVKGTYRHKGMGNQLVDAMKAQYPDWVVSLTAVPGADQFYLNVGFHFTEPQQGHDIFHLIVDRDFLDQKCLKSGDSATVDLYSSASLDALVAYDTEAKGYTSLPYVTMMVDCFPTLLAKDRAGRLLGYVAAFIKRSEIVLDTLCADSDEVACLLLRDILKLFPDNNKLKVQVPSSRLFLSELGQVSSSSKYNRYSIGQPTLSPLVKVYNVSDCDYSY
ncbi:unnamed protein product [Lymnaea stagnalis]|uniref:N-acetyltransferase domain-containing protein n=1 Tax=Lymnaea stagnalis TaxID=6523 RepID=A0AAV2INR6_LYMST